MTTSPWPGTFISNSAGSSVGDPAVYFRREFAVAGAPIRATLSVTAIGLVVPYVNGRRVGDEVLAPGWTSYKHRLQVSTYDVTDLLSDGENAIGAILGEGWAVGPLTWELKRHNWSDRPALYLRLEVEYADRVEIIATDEQFSSGTGAVRENGIYAGETYDARLEQDGWSEVGFQGEGWAPAKPFDWDLDALVVPIAEPIRRIEEVAPIGLHRSASGAMIVDFGQNISGWVRLTVSGDAGTTVTLRHAELLTPGGELERETNRGAEATDRYVLRGRGVETWEPQFTFHGFRYVEVAGWPGDLTADSLRAVVVHSDMTRAGWFESSNELLTKFHDNTVWSMRGNFVGVPTDCPQRDERLGWTGDINAFAPTAAFLYDVRGVLGSWLEDLIVDQAEVGTVPFVVPDVRATWTTPSPTALWGDVAISLPWTLYREYGDLGILRRSYGSMTSFMTQVESNLDEVGLWSTGFQWGDWLDPDAPADDPSGGKTDRYFLASAYLVRTSRELAETAVLLGEDEDAAHYAALHDRVRNAFRHEFVTGSGRLVNETATAYAIVIAFGILEPDQRLKAGDRLAEIVAKAGFTITTGFAGTPVVADALSSTGHLDAAYRLFLQTEPLSFLYPVTMGATTVWERWDSVLSDGTVHATGMTSLNHYALGAASGWLHRVVGGLTALDPGWKRFLVAPQPGGGLTWARTAHDTVHGRAEVAWRLHDGEIHVDVTVPASTTAVVVLPLHPDRWRTEVGPGAHSWNYPAPVGYGEPFQYTFETTIGELARDGRVWPSIKDVFRTHLPAVPLEAAATHLEDVTLSSVLGRLPHEIPGLEQGLRDALTAT